MTTDNTTALLETLAELRRERDELQRRLQLLGNRNRELSKLAELIAPAIEFARIDGQYSDARRRYEKAKADVQEKLRNTPGQQAYGKNERGGTWWTGEYDRLLRETDAGENLHAINVSRRNALDKMRRAATEAGLI